MRCVEQWPGCQELVASLHIRSVGDLSRGHAEERVIGNLCRCGGVIPYSVQGSRLVVYDGIAADREIFAGVQVSFFAIDDDMRVLRERALLDHVVLDYRVAAARKIDAVARRPGWPVIDARVRDGRAERAALYL